MGVKVDGWRWWAVELVLKQLASFVPRTNVLMMGGDDVGRRD
jgi:hypothetical protein